MIVQWQTGAYDMLSYFTIIKGIRLLKAFKRHSTINMKHYPPPPLYTK